MQTTQTSTTTRRRLLGQATMAGAATAVAVPTLAAELQPHPDAALIKAMADHIDVLRARRAIPHEEVAAYEAAWAESARLERLITEAPARTPVGQYVKLRTHFLLTRTSIEETEFMLGLGPRPADLLADLNDQLLWSAMEDARRLAGADGIQA